MSLTWDQLVIVALGAFSICTLIFGFALVAYDELADPEAGRQFDDDPPVDDPIGEDFAAWAAVLQHPHHKNGPDRAA